MGRTTKRYAVAVVAAVMASTAVGLAAPAAADQTFTVTTPVDTADGSCDANCSLREAVAAAEATAGPDVVAFAPELTGATFLLARGQVVIRSELTITGAGRDVTISAGGRSRVLFVSPDTVVRLVGLTIADGFVGERTFGGGIRNRGILTIDGCVLRDNTADIGGAVYSTNELTVTNSLVEGNTATGVVAGIAASGSLAVTASLVTGNNGTGISNSGRGTIVDTVISGNRAEVAAGIDNDGTLDVIRSTVTGNQAGRFGAGGIRNVTFIATAQLTVIDSTISGNRGRFAGGIENGGITYVVESTITANDALLGGGGISEVGFGFALRNSIVAGNTVGGELTDPSADCLTADGESFDDRGGNVFGRGTGCPSEQVDPEDVDDLVLRPLGGYGGPTDTHALVYDPANPTLDIGVVCDDADQRGLPAPLDGPDADSVAECDAGSVEAAGPAPVTASLGFFAAPLVVPSTGGSVVLPARLSNTTAAVVTVDVWTQVVGPDGPVPGLGTGPLRLELAPGQTVRRIYSQTLPTLAEGLYRFEALVGTYPDVVVGGDAVPLSVVTPV